jgi:hypothetical protein
MCVPCMHASVRVAACEKGGRGVQGFQDADHLCQQLNLAVVPDSLVAAALCNAGTRVCVCSSCMAARDSCAPPPFCKPVADSPPEPCLVIKTPPPPKITCHATLKCHPLCLAAMSCVCSMCVSVTPALICVSSPLPVLLCVCSMQCPPHHPDAAAGGAWVCGVCRLSRGLARAAGRNHGPPHKQRE